MDDSEKTFGIPVSFFGPELKEGDVFDISLTPRPDLKKERSDEIGGLLERLRKKERESNENKSGKNLRRKRHQT